MADTPNTGSSLVVANNQGDYYVIPRSALDQFRATAEQKQQIDNVASSMVPGSFARLDADEASTESTFASTPERSVIAWYQNL